MVSRPNVTCGGSSGTNEIDDPFAKVARRRRTKIRLIWPQAFYRIGARRELCSQVRKRNGPVNVYMTG